MTNSLKEICTNIFLCCVVFIVGYVLFDILRMIRAPRGDHSRGDRSFEQGCGELKRKKKDEDEKGGEGGRIEDTKKSE